MENVLGVLSLKMIQLHRYINVTKYQTVCFRWTFSRYRLVSIEMKKRCKDLKQRLLNRKEKV